MSKNIHGTSPAFPQTLTCVEGTLVCSDQKDGHDYDRNGVDERDWFAAHEPDPQLSTAEAAELLGITAGEYNRLEHYPDALAIWRYRCADSMLARRDIT